MILRTPGQIACATYAIDGKRLISASVDIQYGGNPRENGGIQIWDSNTGALVSKTEDVSVGTATAVTFAPDGTSLITGHENGQLSAVDIERGKSIHDLGRYIGPISAVVFSPDGEHFASGDRNGAVCLWSAKTGVLDWTASLPSSESVLRIRRAPEIANLMFLPKGDLIRNVDMPAK